MVAFLPIIATAFASAAANKVLGGNQQQGGPQGPNFQFRPREKWEIMHNMIPYAPEQGAVAQSPIVSAMLSAEAPPPEEEKKNGKTNFKDAFLSSLTQGLIQRALYGSGQPTQTYTPPTFR